MLVNPTLLELAGQRASIDCGGLAYIAVGYRDFTQLILRTQDGHVSLGVSRRADVRDLAARMQAILANRGKEYAPPKRISC